MASPGSCRVLTALPSAVLVPEEDNNNMVSKLFVKHCEFGHSLRVNNEKFIKILKKSLGQPSCNCFSLGILFEGF